MTAIYAIYLVDVTLCERAMTQLDQTIRMATSGRSKMKYVLYIMAMIAVIYGLLFGGFIVICIGVALLGIGACIPERPHRPTPRDPRFIPRRNIYDE